MAESNVNNKLVVLGQFPGQLVEFQRYMQRRDWVVQATSDLKRMLTEVTMTKPQYALISINLSLVNIQKMQAVLERVYRLKIFYYIEEYSDEAWQKMIDLEVSAESKIFGQLSGPAFERALAKFSTQSAHEASVIVPSSKESLSLVLKAGLSTACRKIFNQNSILESSDTKKLAWVQSVSCIYFETSVLSGHFMVAAANDLYIDQNLMMSLQATLRRLYEISGVTLSQEDLYQMKVRKVEFKSWSAQESSFLESAVHNGIEIVVAFFPMDVEKVQLEGSLSDPEMLAIDIDEIHVNRKVEFELFLHLPLNGKFIMYISKGSQMEHQQQLNLQSKGIRKLHVRKADAPKVLRSRSHRHFDQAISNFYEHKAAV